jgi:hypothetical protein
LSAHYCIKDAAKQNKPTDNNYPWPLIFPGQDRLAGNYRLQGFGFSIHIEAGFSHKKNKEIQQHSLFSHQYAKASFFKTSLIFLYTSSQILFVNSFKFFRKIGLNERKKASRQFGCIANKRYELPKAQRLIL